MAGPSHTPRRPALSLHTMGEAAVNSHKPWTVA